MTKGAGVAFPDEPASLQVRADPLRQCRPGHVPRPDHHFRIGRNRQSSIARTLEARRLGGGRSKVQAVAMRQAELRRRGKSARCSIGIGEPDYPAALRRIDGAPPLIAATGDLSLAHAEFRSASSGAATPRCRAPNGGADGRRLGAAVMPIVFPALGTRP